MFIINADFKTRKQVAKVTYSNSIMYIFLNHMDKYQIQLGIILVGKDLFTFFTLSFVFVYFWAHHQHSTWHIRTQ